jgi:ribA/ribD-fused uncharacterized protein
MPPKITKPKHKPRSKPAAKLSSLPAPPSTTLSASQSQASDPLFFYGHTKGPYAFLSQHYACTFTAPPLSFPKATTSSPTNPDASTGTDAQLLTFHTTEQYMMYHKALLFGDASAASQIMQTRNPSAQKALGRKVRGFDDEVWKAHRERIVEEGNLWKFRNGVSDVEAREGGEGEGDGEGGKEKGFKERLLETGDRELVEASPRDRIWGVGFGREKAEANRARWGLNLLGKALMRVRERLREEEERESKGGEVGLVGE